MEFYFLIFIVCFLRDCFCIVVNVFGDVIGVGIVGYLLCDELKNVD